MTCKDCYYYDLCKSYCIESEEFIKSCEKNFEKYGDAREKCEYFKEKSKVIDLPCKVGDTVHYLKTLMDGKGTIVIKKDIVKQISINSHGVFLVISYCYCLNAAEFGKTIFLTPEEAEKALEEREQE